jgi:hypothetical protein
VIGELDDVNYGGSRAEIVLTSKWVSLSAVRVRELIEPLGFVGGKTIVDDYLREVRPLFQPRRAFQRTVYRPGEVCQFDLWPTTEQGPGRARPDPSGIWS